MPDEKLPQRDERGMCAYCRWEAHDRKECEDAPENVLADLAPVEEAN